MTFLKVLPDEDGRVMAVEEGTGSWLTLVFVSAVVMEICIVGLEKCTVALVLNEKFELGVAAKQNAEKQKSQLLDN